MKPWNNHINREKRCHLKNDFMVIPTSFSIQTGESLRTSLSNFKWYQETSALYVLLGFLKSPSMFYLLLHLN